MNLTKTLEKSPIIKFRYYEPKDLFRIVSTLSELSNEEMKEYLSTIHSVKFPLYVTSSDVTYTIPGILYADIKLYSPENMMLYYDLEKKYPRDILDLLVVKDITGIETRIKKAIDKFINRFRMSHFVIKYDDSRRSGIPKMILSVLDTNYDIMEVRDDKNTRYVFCYKKGAKKNYDFITS